jgi:ribonuclease VapC
MIVDTSAVVAVGNNEPSAQQILDALASAPDLKMSAGSLLELFIVADNTANPIVAGSAESLLADANVEIAPVTAEQVHLARQAYRDYGKGNHPARLNFGDCFAYALAKQTREPLLFVGNDFSRTDIDSALGEL